MNTPSDNIVEFTAHDTGGQQRSAMFVRSCILLLIWGMLVASCAMR